MTLLRRLKISFSEPDFWIGILTYFDILRKALPIMPYESIEAQVQSYRDSVEVLVQQKLESKNRIDALQLKAHPFQLEKQRQGLERAFELDSQRQNLEEQLNISSREGGDYSESSLEVQLLKQLDSSSRKLALVLPQDEEDFVAALRWMCQRGSDRESLDLIQTVKSNPPYRTKSTEALLDIAEKSLLKRLRKVTHRYYIFCGNDTRHLGTTTNVIRRYTAFTIVEADKQAIAELRKYYPIDRLDPPPLTEGCYMRDQTVRFLLPIGAESRQNLAEIGVKILRPLDQRTLVVSVPDEAALERLKHLDDVSVSPYVPDIQIEFQHLGQEVAEESLTEARLKATGATASKVPLAIPSLFIAVFFTATDRDQADAKLTAQGINVVSRPGQDSLIFDLSDYPNARTAINVIAEQVGLRSLSEKQFEIPFNNIARRIIADGVIPSNPHPAPLGLTGRNQIIAVADTGLDTGDLATLHLDFQGNIHSIHSFPIAESRSELIDNPRGDNGPSDASGHGTHVAGTLVGNGWQSEALNLPPIQGVAPEAKLIFQAIEQELRWKEKYRLPPTRGLYGVPDNLEELFMHAYQKGARIHSNSWGSQKEHSKSKYDPDRCEKLDNFVWEHKDFLVIVAAGNHGCQEDSSTEIKRESLGSPGVAKNCLTVGASENGRTGEFSKTYGQFNPRCFRQQPFREGLMVASTDHIGAFSSRGPCLPEYQRNQDSDPEYRRKPDVLAPGTFVLSTRSSQIPDGSDDVDALYSPAQEYYMYMSGTSMATPLVAGSAALVRQYLQERQEILHPSAALVKAIIIHSAIYIPDGRDPSNLLANGERNHPDSAPWADFEQGWGRVNLGSILNPDAPMNVAFIDERSGLNLGEERIFKIEISDSTPLLRLTLVYTDFPGENLVNNLNLQLLSPDFSTDVPNQDERYWGNDFHRQDCRDVVNNVEGILIEQPKTGVWTAKVIGTDIPKDTQDFALVISGGKLIS
jgi:serine protease AprX